MAGEDDCCSDVATARWLTAIAERRDRASFAALFQACAPQIKTYFQVHGFRPASAEALTLDVFEDVWREADAFSIQTERPSTWLFRLARRRRHAATSGKPLPDDPAA